MAGKKATWVKPGDKYCTTNYGWLTVIEYRGWRDVLVRFDDTGFETTTFSQSLLLGTVKDPYAKRIFDVGVFW